jgi:rod shape-determining protein MreC
VFPPGYPVARVTAVKRAGSTFATVNARPTAKLNQAREVLLIWFKEPMLETAAPAVATPQPAAPAASAPPAAAPAAPSREGGE